MNKISFAIPVLVLVVLFLFYSTYLTKDMTTMYLAIGCLYLIGGLLVLSGLKKGGS